MVAGSQRDAAVQVMQRRCLLWRMQGLTQQCRLLKLVA